MPRRDKRSTATSPAFELTRLPWAVGALAPVISARTVRIHHGKHHAKYVETANAELAKPGMPGGRSALEVLRWAARHAPDSALFRNAAQAWNHDFYWRSLCPARRRPTGALKRALQSRFGDYAGFADAFASAAAAQFGSGWAWLTVGRGGRLRIETTGDADTPAAHGRACLLTIDVWEHAYYLDYQNRRGDYLEAVIDSRLDWRFAERNYAAARR